MVNRDRSIEEGLQARLFVCIEIPSFIRLDKLAAFLKEHISFFRPSLFFHMTLIFIGELEDKYFNDLNQALNKAANSISKPIKNLRFLPYAHLMGKTISMKLEDNSVLAELVESIQLELDLKSIWYAKNSDPFCAHVALGRFPQSKRALLKTDFKLLLESIPAPEGNNGFSVNKFSLYKSYNGKFEKIRDYNLIIN